jgi:hypothetical protein
VNGWILGVTGHKPQSHITSTGLDFRDKAHNLGLSTRRWKMVCHADILPFTEKTMRRLCATRTITAWALTLFRSVVVRLSAEALEFVRLVA